MKKGINTGYVLKLWILLLALLVVLELWPARRLRVQSPVVSKTMVNSDSVKTELWPARRLRVPSPVVSKTMVNSDSVKTGPKHGKVVVCYIASWAVYRPEPGKFNFEDVDPALCTHLIYAFAGLNESTNTIQSLDPGLDLESNHGRAGYKRLVGLKAKYPHLKVTLSIGGWNEGSAKYSNMASKHKTRAAFIKSVLLMLNNYKFDGLDLDWEYPTKRGGWFIDRAKFVLLVKELSEAFQPHGYILTAALGAGKQIIETAYDFTKLSRYLDLIHMMCYDYHGTWDRVVGANAPLRGTSEDDFLSVEYTMEYMLSHGVPPHKLVLGLPMYGRTFLLKKPATPVLEFGVTAVKHAGFRGPVTAEAGFMAYHEICMEMNDKSSLWAYWHEQSATPFLRDGERVISYDNGRSLARKIKMAIDMNLGGVMVWSMDMDDLKGRCNETDTYIDFVERYEKMVNDPFLEKAVQNLNLLDVSQAPLKEPAYVLKDNRLHLHLSQLKYSNYTLMHVINDAISLSLKEKIIEDEVEKTHAVETRSRGFSSRVSVACALIWVLALF